MTITKKIIGLTLGLWVGFWESMMIVSSLELGDLSLQATIILPVLGTLLVGAVSYELSQNNKWLGFFSALSAVCLVFVIYDFQQCLSWTILHFRLF